MTTVAAQPSRFSIQGTAILSPGCCYICGAINGPFVDFTAKKKEGRVYLCKVCVVEAHTLISPPEDLPEVARGLTEEEKIHLANLKRSLDDSVIALGLAARDADLILSSSEALPEPVSGDGEVQPTDVSATENVDDDVSVGRRNDVSGTGSNGPAADDDLDL